MIDAEYEELDGAEGELDLADTDNLPCARIRLRGQ